MLLLWGTLQPRGGSNLASVRFSGPVRIRCIRIYPKGYSVFAQKPEAISLTEPDAFSLSIFLNAQAAPSAQEPKPKGTNVLVPTTLLYPGGLREFPLDMGPDFVTRLMVIQGDFTMVTLAIFGDAVSEPPMDSLPDTSAHLPAVSHRRPSSSLDPANAIESSIMSQSLLALIPNAPSLSLCIRLMLCFKPQVRSDDWGEIRFADIKELVEIEVSGLEWLGRAAEALALPIKEEVDTEILNRFVGKTVHAVTERTNDHLYALAGLIRRASAQSSKIVSSILSELDLADIFESQLLDKHIVERLHDAIANPHIAQALNSTTMMGNLQTFANSHTTTPQTKAAINALQARLLGWERFRQTLSGHPADIATLGLWIKELTSDDMTCGSFIHSLIYDDSLSSLIHDCPPQEPPTDPIALWNSTVTSCSEIVAFLRALLGICCLLVALSYADDASMIPCIEKGLAVIRLWQETDGYSEIVSHLLLLPRVVYRLEEILRQAAPVPNMTIMHVEQIILGLFSQPDTMIRPELARLVDALPVSTSTISEIEQMEIRELAMISENGLSQAIRSIMTWMDRPVDCSGGRILQSALLIVDKALDDRDAGEWNVMQASWEHELHGLVFHLVDTLEQLVEPIRMQFLLIPPPSLQDVVLTQLLSSANSNMRILSRLLPGHPLPSRLIRSLVHHIVVLFIATDAVDTTHQSNASRHAARVARPTCAETLSILSNANDPEADGSTGELVLRTLLYTARHPEDDDPVSRLEQTFWLLDLLLPLSLSDNSADRTQETFWTRKVIPNLLPDLQQFFRALIPEYKGQLMERLAALDRGEVGLGQWFLDEELRHLLQTIERVNTFQPAADWRAILQIQLIHSLQFLTRCLEAYSTSNIPEWFRDKATFQALSRVLGAMVDTSLLLPDCIEFACAVAPHAIFLATPGQLNLVILLFRGAVTQPLALPRAASVLEASGQSLDSEAQKIADECSPILEQLVSNDFPSRGQSHATVFQAASVCLRWLASHSERLTLNGISEEAFKTVILRIASLIPEEASLMTLTQSRFDFSEEILMPSAISESYKPLTISFGRLTELLTSRPKTPPTPKLSGESIFKMATTSPIAALVGHSRMSTLTKTYQQNEFRELSARQNTSRRPSVHVDDFQQELIATAAETSVVQPMPSTSIQLLPPLKFE
ncbi:hypothetical protein BU17DRAFT_79936 [Hysterangium stoloniferum]|nr:hypothetical protein BU17DRAFT_79936 [Hysterangium stoloniferum]